MRKPIVFVSLLLSCVLFFTSVTPAFAAYPLHPPKSYPNLSKPVIREMVLAALAEEGITDQCEINDALWVYSKESVKNKAHPGGKKHGDGPNGCMYGNWQLSKGKAKWTAWWDPHEATHAAVKYVRKRYKTFHRAKQHKLATRSRKNKSGWY